MTRPIRLAVVPLLLAAAALAACSGGGDDGVSESGGSPIASARPSTAPAAAPTVTTITTGDSGVILLEWTGGPGNATRWQYRQRGPENDWKWTAWADIPGSDAGTRSFRVSGLRDSTLYHFKVRAVTGAVMGEPSEEARGGTPVFDKHDIPSMYQQDIIEGGRTWRVSAGDVVIDVPAGMRLRYLGGMLASSSSTRTLSGASAPRSRTSAHGPGRGSSLRSATEVGSRPARGSPATPASLR